MKIMMQTLLGIGLFFNTYAQSDSNQAPADYVGYWPVITAVNLQKCDADIIRNKQSLETFINLLHQAYEPNAIWEPSIKHCGERARDAGYNATAYGQATTIFINIHNASNSVYVTFIHRNAYNPESIIKLACSYFKAQNYSKHIHIQKL